MDQGHRQHAGRAVAVGPVAGRGVRGGAVIVVERLDHQVAGPAAGPDGHRRLDLARPLVAVQPHRQLGHMGILALGRGAGDGAEAASASWTLTARPRTPEARTGARSRRAGGPAGRPRCRGRRPPSRKITFSIGRARADRESGASGPQAGHRQAPVDVEDLVEPAKGQPGPHAQGQVDQFVVGEGVVEAVPEGLVHAQVVGGVALGELGGQVLQRYFLAQSLRAPSRSEPDGSHSATRRRRVDPRAPRASGRTR